VLNDYPQAVAIGEVWVRDNVRWAEYLRPDELHLGFNFRLLQASFDAAEIRDAIENSLAAVAIEGATPTWTVANHDVERPPTRYGGGARGQARARAMALVLLALPGAAFIYSGEELGLPNVDLPDEALRDPVWERSLHKKRGRDGGRIPLPWEGDAPPFGFSTNPATWLPMPRQWATLTVQRQLADPDSTLSLYRRALALRAHRPEFRGDAVEWLPGASDAVIFGVVGGGLVCALNAGDEPVPLPDGELLLASAPVADGVLAPDTAAWIVPLSQ
jgi:alpha-glucosidase